MKLEGGEDFEIRQEYFLRLLDHYLFGKDRLIGMSKDEVEKIFGDGKRLEDGPDGVERREWQGGRDFLVVGTKDDLVVSAIYIMGY